MPVTYIHTYVNPRPRLINPAPRVVYIHTRAVARASIHALGRAGVRVTQAHVCSTPAFVLARIMRPDTSAPSHMATYVHTYIRSRMYVDWGDIHTYVRPQTRVATATPLVVYIIHARSGACVNSRARTRRRACIRACMRARAACMRACVRVPADRSPTKLCSQYACLYVCMYVCTYVCVAAPPCLLATFAWRAFPGHVHMHSCAPARKRAHSAILNRAPGENSQRGLEKSLTRC